MTPCVACLEAVAAHPEAGYDVGEGEMVDPATGASLCAVCYDAHVVGEDFDRWVAGDR